MEIVQALLDGGAFGIVAAVMLYLYITERASHTQTRDKFDKAMVDRVEDSKENLEKVSGPLNIIAVGIQSLSDKIEAVRNK